MTTATKINPALMAEIEKLEVIFAENKYICEIKEDDYKVAFKLVKVDVMSTPLEDCSLQSKSISVATSHAIMLIFNKEDQGVDLVKIDKYERQPTVVEVLPSKTRYVSREFFEAIYNGRLRDDHCFEYIKLCLGL